jgi:hypothetical protein
MAFQRCRLWDKIDYCILKFVYVNSLFVSHLHVNCAIFVYIK